MLGVTAGTIRSSYLPRIGVDIDLKNLELNELYSSLNHLQGRIQFCRVLIGGTPYTPNSRLLAYILPAVKIAHQVGYSKICLSSTASGGARWNYPKQADKVTTMTDIKLSILEDGLNHFFNLGADCKYNYHLPEEWKIKRLWVLAQAYSPMLCMSYYHAAQTFMHTEQNFDAIGLYGVMHAIWAGDLCESESDDSIGLTYGGAKEAAFNMIRMACLHIPDSELKALGFRGITPSIRIVDNAYQLPVPYGEARAKLFGRYIGPIDVPLIGQEKVGNEILNFNSASPFNVPKPNKLISQRVMADIHSLVTYIAEYNHISLKEAEDAYSTFWLRCREKYGSSILKFL